MRTRGLPAPQAVIFNGMNLYIGNYIGEFLGETTLAAFFLLSGSSMLAEARFPKWLGWSGVVFSFLFLVGAFRNVTTAVQVVADVNNGLLPLWMVVMGTGLIWFSRRPGQMAEVEESAAAARR